MLAALELAAHRLIADPSRPAVLITAADNFGTPMVDRWRASGLFLLADGAAAAVVSSDGGFARVLAAGSLSNPEMEEFNRGGEVLFPPPVTLGQPLNLEARRQYWRDQWAKGVLPPMGNLGELVADVAERTLEEAGVAMDQVRRVVHIGFSKGPLDDTFLDPLDIDGDRGVWEFTCRTGHAGCRRPVRRARVPAHDRPADHRGPRDAHRRRPGRRGDLRGHRDHRADARLGPLRARTIPQAKQKQKQKET